MVIFDALLFGRLLNAPQRYDIFGNYTNKFEFF